MTVDPASAKVPGLAEAAERALANASSAAGLSLAITDGAHLISESAFGLADLAGQRPVSSSTLFEIGSISKGFTAALALQARDSGLLDLDRPVTDYLPWFEVQSSFDPITVKHLLTHTAGIIGGTEYTGDAVFETWDLRHTQATTPPGTWFNYSNTGYKALGVVLQAVYGKPYEQLLAENLLQPLGMASSEPAITHDTRRRLAVGYAPFYDDRPCLRADGLVPATWVETATADGSIASTAVDMTAWLRLLLNDGLAADGCQLVQEHSVREMLSAYIDADVPDQSYGLGMYLGELDGHRYARHGGGMVGYNAAVVCNLDLQYGAVVLANGVGPWDELAAHAIHLAHAARSGETPPTFSLQGSELKTELPADRPVGPTPDEFVPMVGHYRAYNPWMSNIRVQHHDGTLWLWDGHDSTHLGEKLVELPDGSFRIGADERSPERIRFDVLIDGVAIRATVDGCAFYRAFTP